MLRAGRRSWTVRAWIVAIAGVGSAAGASVPAVASAGTVRSGSISALATVTSASLSTGSITVSGLNTVVLTVEVA